jgi:hypothetical protein
MGWLIRVWTGGGESVEAVRTAGAAGTQTYHDAYTAPVGERKKGVNHDFELIYT